MDPIFEIVSLGKAHAIDKYMEGGTRDCEEYIPSTFPEDGPSPEHHPASATNMYVLALGVVKVLAIFLLPTVAGAPS